MRNNSEGALRAAEPTDNEAGTAEPGLFAPGTTILRREVLDGRTWLSYPVRVVADRSDLLAVHLAHGTRLSFGEGDFTWGPHPWHDVADHWRSRSVLQLQRPGDAYAVWVFRDEATGEFSGWYINFQDPYRRTAAGFDTLDHELDLWVPADGGPYRWKDVDEFEQRARTGGFTPEQAAAVRAEGDRVAELLDRNTPWWDQEWAQWQPPAGWETPPVWTGAPTAH
jgi:hypothetical protein